MFINKVIQLNYIDADEIVHVKNHDRLCTEPCATEK